MCLREVDEVWNLTWPATSSGQIVRQKCPGGAESIGTNELRMYVFNYNLCNACILMYISDILIKHAYYTKYDKPF